jgi:hypothetical protein
METPGFQRWVLENFLQSCPGATIENDFRQSAGKEFYEYWAALLPQSEVTHEVKLLWAKKFIDIPPSPKMEVYTERQWSYETTNPVDLASFGPTTRGPIGWRVLGRSGDKASDADAGFFVRGDDEWEWSRSSLTIEKFKQLLGPEYNARKSTALKCQGSAQYISSCMIIWIGRIMRAAHMMGLARTCASM